MSEIPNKANQQIARAAGTVMVAYIISQLTGLAAKILTARAFGASAELDAFYAANRVSETLFALLAGGALSSTFIPAFTSLLVKNDKKAAWKLAASIANLVVVVIGAVAVLAGIFAPQIVRYALAPGLSADPAIFTMTVNLLRIQLGSAVIFALGALAMGILNAHQVFLIPALTPAMYQIGWIIGVLVLVPVMGIYGLAWGVIIGSLLYLLLQFPSLIKHGTKYTLSLGLRNPVVGEVIRLMLPRVFGAAVVQLNFWVNTMLASGMGQGFISSLTFGFQLMYMAQAAIAQSVATAAMPTFSRQHALGETDNLRASLAATLRGVILLSLPAAAGLILLRSPIVTMLYQRGEFSAEDTQLVAWALLWYAAGLVFHSVLEVLVRAFYAMHDTKTPVLVGATAMGLNVGLSYTFAALFTRLGWMPHGGLALANSLATALETTTLYLLMRKRLNGIHGQEIAKGFGAAALGTLGMIAALVFWMQFTGSAPAALTTLGGVALGGAIYGLVLILLRVPEIHKLFQLVKRRLSK
jgi:putative peptidoglycan lipid II flippase